MPPYKPAVGRADKHASNVPGGAPSDFPGVVIPNPTHLEPHLDTDRVTTAQPNYGATNQADNFKGKMHGVAGTDKQVFPDRQLREQ